jgi:hypothetical protein
MLRALCPAMTLVVLSLTEASAAGGSNLGANAALLYWQAFATMPRLTDAEQTKLGEYLTGPLDARGKEIVTHAAYALHMMRLGARLPRCDWGVPYEEGIHVELPHANGARVLANLACIHARMRIAEGQNADALEDIVAGLTLGRHIGKDGVFIMTLTGYAIELRVGETLAHYLPKLDSTTIKALKRRLVELPPGGDLTNGMSYEEKSFLDWFIRKVKEAKNKEDLQALLLPLFHTEGVGKDGAAAKEVRAFLEACGGTADGVLRFAEETRSSYALMAKKLELPLDQFDKEYERETTKRAGNPVFKVFFPALAKVRRAQARIDIRRAQLSAALAVQQSGRDALKDFPDPVVGGAFEYVPFEGGFELRSKLKGSDNQPITLTVGRRGKS